MRHDVCRAALPRGRPDLQPGLSRLAHPLPVQSGQDRQVERHGHDQHARAGQAGARRGCSRPRPRRSTATRPSTRRPRAYWGNVNPIGPRSCYDEGKRVAETLMMDYHRQDRVDIRIARIFNTYGTRMLEARRAGGLQLHRPGAPRRASSRSTAPASRPARSATWTTWSRAWSG